MRCCGMRWPQEPEWTGHACCSKSFKLGSMFKLGAFKACSNFGSTMTWDTLQDHDSRWTKQRGPLHPQAATE
jgi:hypothetical protein